MNGTLTFADWVKMKADAIANARGVSVEDLATEPGELSNQLARCRQAFVAMVDVKADATSWVNKTRAAAIQAVRGTHPKHTADERKVIADADTDYVTALHVRESIAGTCAALKSMHFEILNDRRTSHNPQAHAD